MVSGERTPEGVSYIGAWSRRKKEKILPHPRAVFVWKISRGTVLPRSITRFGQSDEHAHSLWHSYIGILECNSFDLSRPFLAPCV